jgi:hypothetical protein
LCEEVAEVGVLHGGHVTNAAANAPAAAERRHARDASYSRSALVRARGSCSASCRELRASFFHRTAPATWQTLAGPSINAAVLGTLAATYFYVYTVRDSGGVA